MKHILFATALLLAGAAGALTHSWEPTFAGDAATAIGFSGITDVSFGDTLDLSVYNREGLTFGDIAVTYATTVPEPTALALLALGVAGVALRRRAA